MPRIRTIGVGFSLLSVAGIVCVVLVLAGGTAKAASPCSDDFINVAGGSFFTASNWSTGVPTGSSFACVPAATGLVTFAGSDSVEGIDADGAGGFKMTSGTLTITDTTSPSTLSKGTLSSSTITGAGALTLTGAGSWDAAMSGTGTTTVAHGATLTSATTAHTSLARPMVNDGTIVVAGGKGGIWFQGGPAKLTNNADGVIDLQGDGGGLFNNLGGAFLNSGIVKHSSGTGETVISVPITSSLANVQVLTGTLTLENGGTLSGSGTIPAGSTLQFANGGTFTMTNVTLSGAGKTVVATPHGGNTNLSLPVSTTTTINTPFIFAGASTITGAGALTLTGAGSWDNAMSGTGTTTVAHGATLTSATTAHTSLARPMVNDGTIVVAGGKGGIWFQGGPAKLTNNADGVIDLQGDGGGLFNTNLGGSLLNSGLVEHSSGTGETEISIPMTNHTTGEIRVDTGTLLVPTLTNLSSDTLTGGTYFITGALELNYAGGSLVTNAASITLNGTISALLNEHGANSLGSLATNSGTLSLLGGRTLSSSVTTFTNTGIVSIGDGTAGSTLTIAGRYVQTTGTTTVANLSVLAPTASTATIQGGLLDGSGTVNGPLATSGSGTVEDNGTTGPLMLGNGYSGTGVIRAAITSASVFDVIKVTGTATLSSSTLDVSTASSYLPPNGKTFTILTCTVACVGTFSSLALTGGTKYSVANTGKAIILTVGRIVNTALTITTPSLPGATKGQAYSANLAAINGNPPYTWKLVKGSGRLPKGLKLNKRTGIISGTPKKTAKSSTFIVEVLDKKIKVKHHHPTRNTATKVFSITVS